MYATQLHTIKYICTVFRISKIKLERITKKCYNQVKKKWHIGKYKIINENERSAISDMKAKQTEIRLCISCQEFSLIFSSLTLVFSPLIVSFFSFSSSSFSYLSFLPFLVSLVADISEALTIK